MPPEPFPWDRRDFRKHERSGSDPRFGGGYGGGWPPSWRDQHHPDAPPPHPPPYRRQHYQQQQPRWYSDIRSGPLPPAPEGHGKQAGWHMHPDEVGQGFLPFGSRFSDRNLDEENYRPYGLGSDGVRHLRNFRDNRGSFSQKYWRATSWEPVASPDGPGRSAENSEPRSLENTQAHNNYGANNSNENNFSHPTPEEITSEKPDSVAKEQPDKDGGSVDELVSTGKYEKETCLGSINWKPLKWSRSGSLSSRGSSLSRSSSSKSMGVDSIEMAAEVQQKKVTPVQSPTADAGGAGLMTFAATSSEEPISRKKPRLGWGEGLAKYEKKKVDGPEDDAIKNSAVIGVSNIEETVQAFTMNILDKSHRVADLQDCTSPATPSSVACSSSPGIEEKETVNSAKVDHGASNFSCSPSTVSQTPFEVPAFNLENLELSSLSSVSSLVRELLQSGDQSSGNIYYIGANKLFLWKSDISKALELTESEVDSLETELKSLISEPRSYCPLPEVSSLQPEEIQLKHFEEQVSDSNFAFRLSPLHLVSSECTIVENAPVAIEAEHVRLKEENTDNTGWATSKCVEVSTSLEDVYPPQTAKGLVNLDANNSSNLVDKYIDNGLCDGKNAGHADFHELTVTQSCPDIAGTCDIPDIYDSILASNKDSARGASEAFNKLLPSRNNICNFGMGSSVSGLQSDLAVIKKNFLMRKRFLRFKEKTLILKYKIFQHFWLLGRQISVRKLLELSHKKPDLIGHKKHRFSRSRISASAGNSQTVLAEDVIGFVSRLLSESSFKPYRNTLKMPALILDKKEMQISRFISNNGLVEDPCAVETERSMINRWTAEERDIFIEKLATFGKDFRKISSLLDHKTTAECVEFYYKNHKSDCFEKARKKPDVFKRSKSQSTTYLVASGKRWGREGAPASLDILGAASAIVATANTGTEIHQKYTSRFSFGASNSHKAPRSNDTPFRRLDSPDLYENEREAVAADVLAGICGSISSEAMSSCITSSVDPVDGYQDWRCQRVGFSMKRPSAPEVTLSIDEECSDESCGELDSTDWSDMEKSIFIQSLSSYGKDFKMISQCVRTRSRDQCKVFFSKARKCLGLDLIQPGLGNAVSGDANGGGSDVEDASFVETSSVANNEGSDCKMEEHILSPDMKSRHECDIIESKRHLKLDSKRGEENNLLASCDPVDTDSVSKNSLMGNCQLDNHVLDFNVDIIRQNGANGVCISVQELSTMDVSSGEETIRRVDEAADRGLHKESSEAENMGLVEVTDGNLGKDCQEPELLFTNKKVEDTDVISAGISGINCTVPEMKFELQLTENASQPVLDVHSVTEADDVSFRKKAALENYTEKSCFDPLEQNSHVASLSSSTLFSVPIKYQKLSNHNALSAVGVDWVDNEHSQKIVRTGDCQQHLSGHTFSDPYKFLKGSLDPGPIVNEGINGSVGCKKPIPLQNSSHGNLHSAHRAEFSLQKCRSSRYHSHDVEASHPSQQHSVGRSGTQSSCSSNVEKPFRNGGVKLFGKILKSSEKKSNCSGQQTDDNDGQHHKSDCPTVNVKFSGEQKVSLDSAVSKFDCNHRLGSENIPVLNFGFWDRNRTQTGLPPVADASLLLAKYPSAFSNYALPTAKVEQPQRQRLVKSSDRSLNSVSVFPNRDLCNSNGLTDHLKSREVRPFTIDMKNPQDIFITDMQRRNILNRGIVGIQQQSRGIVGINVGRGVLVGGQCSGVTDPVAAIKMHYAKAEQFSLQAGNIMKEDITWRRKGDIGR